MTLRALAGAVGVSTIAVYTYFDGMNGLWANVRQEGFVRLHQRLASVLPGPDPVRHLADLGVAYTEHALANPALYRVMFDAAADLPDPEVAAAGFQPLVDAVRDATRLGRFAPATDAGAVATRFWASGHGLVSLVVGGVLPVHELAHHATEVAIALFISAGDEPAPARRSVEAAWASAHLALTEP